MKEVYDGLKFRNVQIELRTHKMGPTNPKMKLKNIKKLRNYEME
jgi:hypothetical protein